MTERESFIMETMMRISKENENESLSFWFSKTAEVCHCTDIEIVATIKAAIKLTKQIVP